MADVMDHFLRGHAAGQAEKEHEQALETNKLHMLVLKHQIDGLKIEDQLRTREIAKQNLDLLHGQPEADIPSDTVTTQQSNLPATNLAGMMTGLIRDRQTQGMTPGAPPAMPDANAAPDATSVGAPGAQASTPGTNPVTNRVARSINIPGVPGLGVGGVSVRPRSAEDLVQQMMRMKLAEPYTLKDDEQRMVGNRVVAKGGGKKVVVPAGGTLIDESNPTQPLATGGPGNSEFAQFQQIYAEGLGATSFKALTAAQKAGAIPAFTKMKQDPALAGLRVDAADARAQATQFNEDFRRYSEEVSQQQKAHAEKFKTWQKAADNAFPDKTTGELLDSFTSKPIGDAPEYTPQTFEEWRAAHPAPVKTKPGAKGAPAKPGAKAAAPKDGTTGTIQGKPVVWQTIPGKGAGWVAAPPQP